MDTRAICGISKYEAYRGVATQSDMVQGTQPVKQKSVVGEVGDMDVSALGQCVMDLPNLSSRGQSYGLQR